MMSKERLEEIEKFFDENIFLVGRNQPTRKHMSTLIAKDNIEWIISRVEELEEENAGLHDILAQIEYQEKDKLLAENKRYREVIKKAIDDLENECLWDALVALKELEGEK